ncbi:MAG: DSD1 family PLP-dependent enzyme [Limnochordia bacterium]|jgi:D-serine deaminase-like pyridoxal phosphate-dependent protein
MLLPKNLEEIPTPALLIDLDIMEENLRLMGEYFANRTTKLRPHAKTHKSPTIAWKQLDHGAIGITCAKLGEAEILVRSGIKDVLLANQVTQPAKIRRLVALARHSNIIVACDSPANADDLNEAALAKGVILNVLIEADVGLGRCGVQDAAGAVELTQHIERLKGLRFRGIMGYEGHCVFIADAQIRREKAAQANGRLVAIKEAIERAGIPVEIVSAGGTGTYDLAGSFPGITEIQAGSYLFMDATYEKLGLPFRPALFVLTSVISRPRPDVAVVDAGKKAITEEFGLPQPYQLTGVVLEKLSEEHGLLRLGEDAPKLEVNDLIRLLPTHCCTTINLHDRYYGIRGGQVETIWPIAARGAIQ